MLASVKVKSIALAASEHSLTSSSQSVKEHCSELRSSEASLKIVGSCVPLFPFFSIQLIYN